MALIISVELLTQPVDLSFCSRSAIFTLCILTLDSRLFLIRSSSLSRSSWVLATSFWSFLRIKRIVSHFSKELVRSSTWRLIVYYQILTSSIGLAAILPFWMNLFLKLSFLIVFSAPPVVESARRLTSWMVFDKSKWWIFQSFLNWVIIPYDSGNLDFNSAANTLLLSNEASILAGSTVS